MDDCNVYLIKSWKRPLRRILLLPQKSKTKSGDFIIADNGNHRIVKMNAEGQFIGWFSGSYNGITLPWSSSATRPEKGDKIGYLAHPFHAIEVGNKIYVADGHNNRIVVYPTPQ